MFVKLLVALSNSLQLIGGYVFWEPLNKEHMSHEYTASGQTWTSQTQVTELGSLRNPRVSPASSLFTPVNWLWKLHHGSLKVSEGKLPQAFAVTFS